MHCVHCVVCVHYVCAMTDSTSITTTTDASVLFDRYLADSDLRPHTRATYVSAMRRFVADLDGRQVSTAAIAGWRDHLLASGWSVLSVNAYLSAVRTFMAWAAAHGLCHDHAAPVRSARADKFFRRDPLSASEAAHLLACAPDARARLVLELELRAGLRGVELHRMNVGDRQTRRGRDVVLVQGKGRDAKDGLVVLCPETVAAWDAYMVHRGPVRPSDPLLVAGRGRGAGARMTVRSIRRIVTDALMAAKVKAPTITAHSLRHTCADLLIRAGANITDVQQVLRHSSADTTMIYTKRAVADARLAQPVELTLSHLF